LSDAHFHSQSKRSSTFLFTLTINSECQTNPLVPKCPVFQEEKGGRAYQKLGFVDIDLAQFAGCGLTTRRYLLEGYNDKKHRQDNSTLKLQVDCTLLTGDPLFKRPSKTSANLHVPSYGSASNSKDNTMNSQLNPNDLAEEAPLHETAALAENNNLVSCSDHNDPLSRHSTLKEDLLLSGKSYPLKFGGGLLLEDATALAGSVNIKQGEDCNSGESVSSGFGSLPRYKHDQRLNTVQGNTFTLFLIRKISDIFYGLYFNLIVFFPDQEINDEIKGHNYAHPKSGENTASHSRQSSGEEVLVVYVMIFPVFLSFPNRVSSSELFFVHSVRNRDHGIFGSNERLKQLHQNTLPANTHLNKQTKPQYATLQPAQQRLLRGRLEHGDNLNNKVDATRVDCEDIVNEIIESQLRENDCSLSQEPEFGLELVVAKDGTAKLGSKAITRTRKACNVEPATNLFNSHSNPNSRPNSSIETLRSENV
jgi:hypothetical protein